MNYAKYLDQKDWKSHQLRVKTISLFVLNYHHNWMGCYNLGQRIGGSVISVRYGHAWACLGRHVTLWNISMTSSQLGLPPWKIWTYLLKRFMRYLDLKNGAIWLAESHFQNISRTRFFQDMRFFSEHAGHFAE